MESEEKNNQKYLIIIVLLIITVVFLILFLWLLQKKATLPKEEKSILQPTPTKIKNIFEVPTETPIPTENQIPPASQTGVLEEELPPQEKKLAEQKIALKKALPIKTEFFDIDFDYSEDKFVVNLKSPKTTSQQQFINWLTQNYPDIPLDRFIFK